MCCFGEEKDSDEPQTYESSRSCTDVVFAIIFLLTWLCFVGLSAFAIKENDFKNAIYGADYLGFYCGQGEGPADFSDRIPDYAPFQSKNWTDNTHVWYPLPLTKGYMAMFNPMAFFNIGVCVKTCPTADAASVATFLNNPGDLNASQAKALKVYSYGTISRSGPLASSASEMYVTFNTTALLRKCLPTLEQSQEVRDRVLMSPYAEKVYAFVVTAVREIQAAWRVIVIMTVVSLILCFVFVYAMRLIITAIVWFIMFLTFAIMVAAGSILLYLYIHDGKLSDHKLLDTSTYGPFLIFGVIFAWAAALVFCFMVLGMYSRVRLACAMVKISSRVVVGVPSAIVLPIMGNFMAIALLVWSIILALCLYTARDTGKKYSLIPVTDSLKFTNVDMQVVENSTLYNVTTEALNSQYSFHYILLFEVFAFLWSVGFINALCFTSAAFVCVFWYFSTLGNDKRVPFCCVLKAVCWTLFYHSGTIALGSFLITTIQIMRLLLTYFVEQAKESADDNHLIRCLACYLKCLLSFAECVLETVNRNAYVMMCLTSHGFCISAYKSVSLFSDHFCHFTFLHWMIDILMLTGKFFIIIVSCIMAFFLCREESVAPGVESGWGPIIVVGLMSFLTSSVFFSLYESCSVTLLVCYCHDRSVNESLGVYYVPVELEHQLGDYSQMKKLQEQRLLQKKSHQE
ncbi:putative Plasma membrane choline transporter [Trypanosoma vivax]|nr:putative Plasma membrane choline transporter [Trypanosoma vivax]